MGARSVAAADPLVTAAVIEGPASPPAWTRLRRTVRFKPLRAEIMLGYVTGFGGGGDFLIGGGDLLIDGGGFFKGGGELFFPAGFASAYCMLIRRSETSSAPAKETGRDIFRSGRLGGI